MQFTEVYGDLFSAPEEYALAHCVAADMRMGAGIATTFKYVLIILECPYISVFQ